MTERTKWVLYAISERGKKWKKDYMYATIQKPTFDLKWAYNNRLLKVGWMKEVRKSFQQKNVES